MEQPPIICELCDAEAAVFCPSDAANLCFPCDAKVHQANFLVARHFRHPLIGTHGGGGGGGDDSLSSSKEYSFVAGRNKARSSSSVVREVAKSRPPVGRYFNAEDIFLNWIGKLGVGDHGEAVGIGCRALGVCLDRWKVWPLRLCLAASLCLGLRAKSVITWQVLKRLQQLSSVPAKLILAAESKLRGGCRRRVELEEGWAEC